MQTWLSKRYVFSIDFPPNVCNGWWNGKYVKKSADLTDVDSGLSLKGQDT